MTDEDPKLTEDQQNFISTDGFISLVMKKRKGGATSGWLRIFLESPGGTAAITVIIGAIATGIITGRFQESQADRDSANRMIESFGVHKLAVTQKSHEDRSQVLNEGLTTVDNMLTKAESRISIDGPAFATRINKEAEKVNREQKAEVRRQFNAVSEFWDTRKVPLEFSIGIYVSEASSTSWKALAVKVDAFVDCANDHVPAITLDSCDIAGVAVRAAIQDFLDAARGSAVSTSLITQEEVQAIRNAVKKMDR